MFRAMLTTPLGNGTNLSGNRPRLASTGALAVLTLLVAGAAASSAQAGKFNFEVPANYALYGPDVKGLWVGTNHQYNVKKAMVRRGITTVVRGQISVHARFLPDEQWYYTIVKYNGAVKSIELRHEDGDSLFSGDNEPAFRMVIGRALSDSEKQAKITNMNNNGYKIGALEGMVATIALLAPNDTIASPQHATQPWSAQTLQPAREGHPVVSDTPTIRDHRGR